MYIKHCKLSKNKQLELMKYFIAGATARTAADLVGIHRNSGVRFFHKLREKIALKQQDRSEQFGGSIELDESYFGGSMSNSISILELYLVIATCYHMENKI